MKVIYFVLTGGNNQPFHRLAGAIYSNKETTEGIENLREIEEEVKKRFPNSDWAKTVITEISEERLIIQSLH